MKSLWSPAAGFSVGFWRNVCLQNCGFGLFKYAQVELTWFKELTSEGQAADSERWCPHSSETYSKTWRKTKQNTKPQHTQLDWGVIQGQELKYSGDLNTYPQAPLFWTARSQVRVLTVTPLLPNLHFWENREFSHGFSVQGMTPSSRLNNSNCVWNSS